jgi:hypothetical protein
VHVLRTDIQLAVLAARSRGEDVVVVPLQLIDLADGVDVRERAAQHERHDDEVVVRVHVVARAVGHEDLVAEHLHHPEPWNAGLVFMKIEARMAGDGAVRMACDVAGIEPDRRQVGIAAFPGTQHEANAHCGLAS